MRLRASPAPGMLRAPAKACSMLHRAARDLTDAHHRLVITVRRQHRSKPYHRGQGSLAEAVA
jgi:hypothetical protein